VYHRGRNNAVKTQQAAQSGFNRHGVHSLNVSPQ
jgi:hypothetical protein